MSTCRSWGSLSVQSLLLAGQEAVGRGPQGHTLAGSAGMRTDSSPTSGPAGKRSLPSRCAQSPVGLSRVGAGCPPRVLAPGRQGQARAGAVKEGVCPSCPTPARRHRSKDAGKPSAPWRLLSMVQGGVHPSQSKHLSDGGSLTLPGKLPRVGSSSAPMGSGQWTVVPPSPRAPAFPAEANSGTTLTPRPGSGQKSHEAQLPAPPPGSSGRGPGRPCAATRQRSTKDPFVRILLCANRAAGEGGGVVAERLGARAIPSQPGLEPQSHPRLGEQTCLVRLSGAGASDATDPKPGLAAKSGPHFALSGFAPSPVLDSNQGQQAVARDPVACAPQHVCPGPQGGTADAFGGSQVRGMEGTRPAALVAALGPRAAGFWSRGVEEWISGPPKGEVKRKFIK